MIDLNKEAEEYYPNNPYWIGAGESARLYDEYASKRIAFIKGTNSKYVQQKVLQAQIDILTSYKAMGSIITEEIENLEKQLKQLEE
jgi:DNA-binding transcriptional MerR regulator